eukprot:8806637-Pyramimonas_sp.AAC.1
MAAQAGFSDGASQGEITRVAQALTQEFWSIPRSLDAVETVGGSGGFSFWLERSGLQGTGFDKSGRGESGGVCALAGLA